MTSPLRRVLPATAGRAVDARAVGELVRQDASVRRHLEAYVNAFYTRFDGRIEGGDSALRVAGGQVVALIGLLDALVEPCRGRLAEPVAGMIWADAIGTGVAARLLAEVDRSLHPDVAFAVGMLGATGTARLLVDDPEAQLTWWRTVRRDGSADREQAIDALFGAHPSCEAGSAALDLGVPDELVRAIAVDIGQELPEPWGALVGVRDLARGLIRALGCVQSGPALREWVVRVCAARDITDSGAWALIDEVMARTTQLADALELPVTPWLDRDVLLQRHGRADVVTEPGELATLAALQAETITALRARATRLEIAMTERLRIDPVTDLMSFQTFIGRLGAALRDPDATLGAIVVVDVQDLGAMMVREGLQTTDRLLARVAQVLDRTLRDAELITRCGPGTFLVAMPADARLARILAERVRSALGSLQASGRSGVIPLRTEVAVLDLDDLPLGVTAEAVVVTARQALAVEQQPRWVRVRG